VTAPRLELRGVGHAYGGRVVLAGVEHALEPGRALGLLGPNGSGKSTLLRCIAGLLRPRAGHVLVDGRESCELGPAERARVAYAGHRPLLWGGLSARENLLLCAGLYGMGAYGSDGAERSLAAAGLTDQAELPAASLSQGQRQRLALARALLPSPALLVLDEPHSGLDETSCARLDGVLAEARGNVTLVLATHERARAARLCDELLQLEVLR
jgi:heme ABC exporter ATP-binding subunit CcmA